MMRMVYRVVWDGEPSMSGEPHVQSVGKEFTNIEEARTVLDWPQMRGREGLRIQGRLVSEWRAVHVPER